MNQRDVEDLFGGPLRADPYISLKAPPLPDAKIGPLPKIQFVIEFVGPRSISGASANALAEPQLRSALGSPEVWTMNQSSNEWAPLRANVNITYDSLAVAWDLITDAGTMTTASARQLLAAVERFATDVQRRAMPMPVPESVDPLVRHWIAVRESLDIGFSMAVARDGDDLAEREIWRLCAALGLNLGPTGAFEWRIEGWEHPLLAVTPLEADAFSLRDVNLDAKHRGLGLGFNVPRSPSPSASLEGCFGIANQFALRTGSKLFDDTMAPMTPADQESLRSDLNEAVKALASAGLTPGCSEALKLFGAA
ncbi:MAG: hypothetical protein HYR64_01185 [Fimbriimonas ginsengisoli]|uniref:Cell division protein ZipA n=1 Tax=Fimbriimonas ginsengisoli TaxID=1005039 RepID=A0A931LQP4_FIMGI|nr:hypothetical protein [Fimbriimonas ginsengisoli]